MKKITLLTISSLSFALIACGLFVYAFFSFGGQLHGIVILTLALLSSALSTFLLFYVKRLRKMYIEELSQKEKSNVEEVFKSESIIEKQNELLSQWNETNEKRDKLKMLKIASTAPEE